MFDRSFEDGFDDQGLSPDQRSPRDESGDSAMGFDAFFRDDSESLDFDALRSPLDAPDQCGAILDRVGYQRGWLSRIGRRRVAILRVAAAIVLLGGVAAIYLGQRYAPDSVRIADEPAPMTDFVRSGAELPRSAAATLGDVGQVVGLFSAAAADEMSVDADAISSRLTAARTASPTRRHLPATPDWIISPSAHGTALVLHDAGQRYDPVLDLWSSDGPTAPSAVRVEGDFDDARVLFSTPLFGADASESDELLDAIQK